MSLFDAIMEGYLNSQEVLNEDVIYDDNRYTIAVDSTKGNTGQGASYFKFYDKKKKEISRILVTEPSYTRPHRNSGRTNRGGERVKSSDNLTETQKKNLVKILNSKPTTGKYKDMDNTYQAVVYAANKLANIPDSEIEKYKDKSPEDTPRNIIPYNMEMPDYMNL